MLATVTLLVLAGGACFARQVYPPCGPYSQCKAVCLVGEPCVLPCRADAPGGVARGNSTYVARARQRHFGMWRCKNYIVSTVFVWALRHPLGLFRENGMVSCYYACPRRGALTGGHNLLDTLKHDPVNNRTIGWLSLTAGRDQPATCTACGLSARLPPYSPEGTWYFGRPAAAARRGVVTRGVVVGDLCWLTVAVVAVLYVMQMWLAQ